jgi:WD40 repeat protein
MGVLVIAALSCAMAMNPADLNATVDAHTAAVNALDVTPAGDLLYSAGKDGKVNVWDTASLELVASVPACQVSINDIVVTPDGAWVVTAGDDGFVKFWDAATSELVWWIAAHEGAANTLAAWQEPEGGEEMIVYSGGDDGYVRGFAINEDFAQVLNAFTNYNGVNDIILNTMPNGGGDLLFAGGVDGRVTVINTESGLTAATVQAYENAEVLVMALDPMVENCLFTGGTNGEIRAWDARTGSLVKTVRAHAGNVNSLYVDMNAHLLVSAGADGKVKLWNHHGQLAGEMQAHVLAVKDFLRLGDSLVTGGADFKVRVWNANF